MSVSSKNCDETTSGRMHDANNKNMKADKERQRITEDHIVGRKGKENVAIDNKNKAQCPETEDELIPMLVEERSQGKGLIFQNTGLGHNLINTRLTPSRYNYIKRYYIDLDSPLPDKEICRWHKRGLCKFKED